MSNLSLQLSADLGIYLRAGNLSLIKNEIVQVNCRNIQRKVTLNLTAQEFYFLKQSLPIIDDVLYYRFLTQNECSEETDKIGDQEERKMENRNAKPNA